MSALLTINLALSVATTNLYTQQLSLCFRGNKPRIEISTKTIVKTVQKRNFNKKINFSAGGENALQSLSPSDRAKIAENRQVMRAYLISKLVAPRYDVDTDGKINPEHFKKGHLGSEDMEQRQRTVVQLIIVLVLF